MYLVKVFHVHVAAVRLTSNLQHYVTTGGTDMYVYFTGGSIFPCMAFIDDFITDMNGGCFPQVVLAVFIIIITSNDRPYHHVESASREEL